MNEYSYLLYNITHAKPSPRPKHQSNASCNYVPLCSCSISTLHHVTTIPETGLHHSFTHRRCCPASKKSPCNKSFDSKVGPSQSSGVMRPLCLRPIMANSFVFSNVWSSSAFSTSCGSSRGTTRYSCRGGDQPLVACASPIHFVTLASVSAAA
jgi:hypothetical protein